MKYPLFKIKINQNKSIKLIQKVFKSGFINEGSEVNKLTNILSKKLGSKNIVLTNSGTSALTIAYKLAGVKSGKNVVSSPMTCIASNTPIINLGGGIKWADVDHENGMITIETIKKKIDKDTVAVSFVNWGGVIPEIDKIYKYCKSKKIIVIQDAAHSFLAKYKNKPLCNYADFTCYSFQAIKHFTCGDGGAIISKSSIHFKKSKKLKWFGYDRDNSKDRQGNWKKPQEDVDIQENDIGFKFNMNNISAAIGLGEIKNIDSTISKHVKNAKLYDYLFKNHNKIFPIKKNSKAQSVYWVYTLILDKSLNRDKIINELKKFSISSGQIHVPNDLYSCFKRYKTKLPGVREFSKRQINLPCGWWLKPKDIKFIAKKLISLAN
mgnify:CR=1 FL=1|tara:strand:- start:7764 stop:8900 length:1137 start_codon:yes stop_codon:yes gene_type:complete